jgi:hypothetical protein
MSNENTNQSEIKIVPPAEPIEPVEKKDVVVEVTGFQIELFKGL